MKPEVLFLQYDDYQQALYELNYLTLFSCCQNLNMEAIIINNFEIVEKSNETDKNEIEYIENELYKIFSKYI